MKGDNFIEIYLTRDNLDRYIVRKSILDSLTSELKKFNGKLLDVGCGKMPYKKYILKNSSVTEYIGLDIESAIIYDQEIRPDFYWDGVCMPFSDNSFDCIFITEVLEHCPDPKIILSEIYRVLKPGGVLFFTIPFLWPLHEVPHDEYRYTPFSMKRNLTLSGFSDQEIKALGGWHSSMAQMIGLWVRRSQMSYYKKYFLSFLMLPIIKYLIYKDKKTNIEFVESQMITGLTGTAIK